jgi:hypothetical protein
MKFLLLFISFFFIKGYGYAQVLSQFSWDSNPVTTAVVGPNAISVNASATSSVGGVGGTNGLNAGLPKSNLDFIIPGSAIFNVPGIDISFDFQRDENGGTFIKRGNSLVIGGVNSISVSYRVDDGVGGFNTVSSGNVYSLPNDNTFRTYRFYYTPTTGVGVLSVDGDVKWSNDGPDCMSMYWEGSGDIIVGEGIDGTGFNRTLFDNLIIAGLSCIPLPIELISFEAHLNTNQVDLKWITASEINNDFFTVERSVNLNDWEEVLILDGAGNSNQIIEYFDSDVQPLDGLSYYRLKQTDFNGYFAYSNIIPVNFSQSLELNRNGFSMYPNPLNNGEILNIKFNKKNRGILVVLRDIHGREVYSKMIININDDKLVGIPIGTNISKGIYLIIASSDNEIYSKKLIIR